uniref:Xylulose kinase-1 n=1 Tax=Tanacetum cinerariifolium TaxID=118510 RepID=A0A6L2JXH8_TANCI|nr:hypothetical protein [Tanacetum cinerariifolium]
MERAATIASSLEAEQASGNINRTQSMATLNEPLPQGTGLGSGYRCQVTILRVQKLKLEKPSESEGFEQIIDFLNAKPIRYALTMNPTVYASCVKQFWTIAKVKKVNDQEHIQALVDKQKVIITEESIRRDLKFDDVEGTVCLPNDTIFAESARMGGGVKFLMFPRFLQVFLDKQVEGMVKHKEIYVISSHTKKKKIKPKRKQRQATEVHSPSSKIPVEESIPTPSNDLLPSGEDSIQLNELMIFCTNLQQQVLDLEEAKISQANEIAKLKKRVKKLEKRKKSRPEGLRD